MVGHVLRHAQLITCTFSTKVEISCHVAVLSCVVTVSDSLLYVSDATLTTDNLAEVMELVTNWGSLGRETLTEPPIIPLFQLRANEMKSSTKRAVANECASYYVQSHPLASWTHLAACLYYHEEFDAVEKLKPFLPLRGKCL